MPSRRRFLSTLAGAAAALPFARADAAFSPPGHVRPALPDVETGWRGESAFSMGVRAGTIELGEPPFRESSPSTPPGTAVRELGAGLRRRYPDLRRRFVFEYYPWYSVTPWRHWDQWDRHPPVDIAATSMPLLGPYDSRSAGIVEQHARWMAEAGVGAINISWWGRGSREDLAVPLIMDVMRDHDIHVTFHLEPYGADRIARYEQDILYLLREYGEKRHWDCFLLLGDARGNLGPVLKSFRTMVPRTSTDCHGVTRPIPDYVPDATWRRQTDAVRAVLREDFDRVVLLADVSDFRRMLSAGFDGMAIYDNFVLPSTWPSLASACSADDLVFSFNVNPGFDGIALRQVPPDSCYAPTPVTPAGTYDWSRAFDRDRAARRSEDRIVESLRMTLRLQTQPGSSNDRSGFFIVYVNSFNEWHEGHQFEPMKDAAALTDDERAIGYHNPSDGAYRLRALTGLLAAVFAPGGAVSRAPSPEAVPW
jgi:Glycosyl hydrolase family 99